VSRTASKLVALAVSLSVTEAARPLRAEPAATIEFSTSELDCPEPSFVNQHFLDLVGAGVQTAGRAVVSVTKTSGGEYEFLIRINNSAETGERRFFATSCMLGSETAALIIAISLFPERANDFERRSQTLSTNPQPTPRPPDRTTASTSDDRQSAARAPVRPLAPSAPDRALHGSLSLATGLDTTSMPAPGFGFGVAASFGIDRISVEVTGAQFVEQTLELPDQRGARFVLITLGAHACYSFGRRPLVVSPCLGASGLRLSGEGLGAQRNFERVGVYGGPALGAAIRWFTTEWLAVRIYAESFVSLVRPSFVLENQFVHRPAAIGLSAFAGPELQF
jgi:hypothetical protein